MNELKENVAEAALAYVGEHRIIGVGTGSTANYFINALASLRHRIDACVPSSIVTAERLRAVGLPVMELSMVDELPIYIDGADEVNHRCEMIKGGGGALTREKIVASVAKEFIALVEKKKVVPLLGQFPVAVEVLAMARSFVARELVKLGGSPMYRAGFVTDNGHVILDVHHFDTTDALSLEEAINRIPGVIENGLFIRRPADRVLVVDTNGSINELRPS